MKFLLVDHDYSAFQAWLYDQYPWLGQRPYVEQMAMRNESLFGVADFYSRNLSALGHVAGDVHANNPRLQYAWACEHGMTLALPAALPAMDGPSTAWRSAIKRALPHRLNALARRLLDRVEGVRRAYYAVLGAQIRDAQPDILLNFHMENISASFLRRMRPYVGCVIGHRDAVPLPPHVDVHAYDLVLSSFPATVDTLRARGVPSAYYPFGFEHTVRERIPVATANTEVSFVGSLGHAHAPRVRFLEQVAAQVPQLRLWAPGIDHLPSSSILRTRYEGQAWGRRMYEVLQSSQVVINQHGESPLPYANNMRLFEGTGIGACVLTDEKDNLGQLFEPGREVAVYRDAADCVRQIHRLLANPGERASIASAGQQRTLREHTYAVRARELVALVEPIFSGRHQSG